MNAPRGEERPMVAGPDAENAPLRVRTAAADAAFVAEGVALGLPLKWIDRAPLPNDPSPRRPWVAR